MVSGGDGPSYDELYREREATNRARAQYEAQMTEEAKAKRYMQSVREDRNIDMAEGRKRGEELFGDGKMGRVEEGRAAEIADLIDKRRAALDGLSPEEQNAMRDSQADIVRATQGQLRQLRGAQARSGVQGAAATAQQMGVLQGQTQAMANAERDIFLKNQEARRGALDKLEGSLQSARADELGRQQFNIGQGQREKYGQITSELGFASLGAGERSAVMQRLIGEQQAAAAQAAAQKDDGKK